MPYTNKREAILQAHIQKLKEYNKELTIRLKALKGCDNESSAASEVKVNVLNEYSKEHPRDEASDRLIL